MFELNKWRWMEMECISKHVYVYKMWPCIAALESIKRYSGSGWCSWYAHRDAFSDSVW